MASNRRYERRNENWFSLERKEVRGGTYQKRMSLGVGKNEGRGIEGDRKLQGWVLLQFSCRAREHQIGR